MAAIGFKSALSALAKDQPSVGDVHISSAGGTGKKRRRGMAARIGAAPKGDSCCKYAKAESIDKKLGMVFGYGIICKEDGVDYYDVQDDHIPEDAMLKAAADFAASDRHHKEMHTGDENAQWLFLFPMTTDIAKAFGMTTRKTGLMMGFKPPADVLAKFENGEYTGFSIGGDRIKDEEVD